MKKNILIFADDVNQYVTDHIVQLLSKAYDLSKGLECQVEYVCFGQQISEDIGKQLYEHGADDIYFYQVEEREMGYLDICDLIAEHIRRRMPEIILVPASENGKRIAAVLSARFQAGLTADCIDLELSKEHGVIFTRAALSDSVVASIVCTNCEIKMGTVKKDVFRINKRTDCGSRQIYVEAYECKNKYSKPRILMQEEKKQEESIDLNRYTTIFCLGRGVRDEETIRRFKELADKMNAGLVATRTLVEKQFMNKEFQVGQSGKSIAPRRYLSFGVSGASQHIVGIRNAERIIAINTDRSANINQYADYAVVEDLYDILDEMERQIIG